MNATETSLIRRVSDTSDAASWDEFVKLYEPLLLSYVRSRGLPRADAPDVVQDIFIRLLRALPKFTLDRRRGRFRTWLYQVTMSVTIDRVRSKAAREASLLELQKRLEGSFAANDEPDDDFIQAHRRRALEFAHSRVKEKTNPGTWACYEQRFLHSRPCADIAAELGITANAVSVNAGRVLERVRALCADYLEELDDD